MFTLFPFPRSGYIRGNFSHRGRFMEKRHKHPPLLPEYWLYWTYLRPELLRQPLRSSEGHTLAIIEPGRRNEDNGPDFINAILEINGMRCRGDVEFHLTPREWFRHGHAQDERYRNVALHVLWDAPGGIPVALRGRFPHLLLRSHLNMPEEAWRAYMIELEGASDAGSPAFQDPGALSPARIADLAEQRFRRKIERLRSWFCQFSPEDLLYIALAEALGYSKNKFPFRQLMWECPPSRVYAAIPTLQRSPLSIWIYLALRGGLLPPAAVARKTLLPPSLAATVREIYEGFARQGFYPLLGLRDWNFSRLRPSNHPVLRLAALAQLLYRHQSPGLWEKLLAAAMQRLPLHATLPAWEDCFRCRPGEPLGAVLGYFLRRSHGSPHFRRLPGQMIGATRLKQFFVNGLLPLLITWAERSGNQGFRAYLEGLFEAFPSAEDPGVIRRQLQLISDPALARRIAQSAFYQQGMLELAASRAALQP